MLVTMRTGTLRGQPLPQLLFHLNRERFDGILRLAVPGGRTQLYFCDGSLAAIDAADGGDPLGALVVATGLADQARILPFITTPRPAGQLLGRALIAAGVITNGQLAALLRLQLQRRLHRLYAMLDAPFEIDGVEHTRCREEGISLRHDPFKSIVEGVRDQLSSFKLPRQVVVVPEVPRAPNGKADYPRARELFESSSSPRQ